MFFPRRLKSTLMEEEAQKRNTDCLYFLASPLTCKKGSECEYRHSDSARLNPRDCWYWLNGSCRNPNCAFRHPPLEGFNGVKADSLYIPSYSGIPTNKSDVPCYFYLNAICAKGEQCLFLHDSLPAQKVSKAVPEATTNPPREVKISISDTGPPSVELPVNPPVQTLEPTKKNNYSNQVPQPAAPLSALEEPSHSAESMVPESEEPTDNLLPAVEFMDHNGQLSPYQSSEELVKECVEQELDERWESSPGFDVIVDDGSEQLANEDGVEYQFSQNDESKMLRSRLLGYDFEGSAGYEHAGYSEAGYLYDQCLYDSYDHMNDGYSVDYFQQISDVPREERTFKPMYEPMYDRHRKRKLLHRVHEAHIRENVLDLREQLRKRRRIDAHHVRMNSGRQRRSHGQERPLRNRVNCSVHGRLASQVGRCMITSLQGERESTFEDHDRQGWRGRSEASRFMRPRLRERERRRHGNPPRNSSKIQLTSALDGEESVKAMTDRFAGPKTLAQIKEEKCMVKADGKSSLDLLRQRRKQQETFDFESPKSLEELLKDKRRSERPQDSLPAKLEDVDECFQVEKKPSGVDVNDWHLMATSGYKDREFVNGYVDDEQCDDDDDFFQKQLAHMFSH